MTSKIAIIGLGPSGIYCAINMLEIFKNKNFNDFHIDLYDKNEPLLSILPTGNGRCNITNNVIEPNKNYPRGAEFLKSVFKRHSNKHTINFLNKIGIETYIQDDNRIFPVSNSSKDVRNKFLKYLNKFENFKIIKKEIFSFDEVKNYDYIVFASGSRKTQELIKSTNHNLIPFKKALVSINFKQDISNLEGTSVKTNEGDFVFTRKGITGPFAFKISSINAYEKIPYDIKIKLVDENDLKEAIKNNPKKEIGTIFSNFIPKKLAHAIIKDYNKKAAEISKKTLIEYSNPVFTVISHNATGEIVNAGGVDLNQIDKNCSSKIKNNLYFIGEILNIDGFTGGYNLQACFSTGYVAAYDITKRVINGK